jgi:DeoR/GlpR family transcriptional regulator of sugar metabolism
MTSLTLGVARILSETTVSALAFPYDHSIRRYLKQLGAEGVLIRFRGVMSLLLRQSATINIDVADDL